MECQHPLSLHYLSVNQSPAGQVENESVIARAMYAANFVFHTPVVTCPVGCKLVLQIFRQRGYIQTRGLYSDRGAIETEGYIQTEGLYSDIGVIFRQRGYIQTEGAIFRHRGYIQTVV